ncbi:cation efflux system protein [Hymenobacter qilianensis]|uniref:Cation transporter n=2 Tax=Hymenobacter qilianensis TaxID=1385715 RepID=A0A7H0H1R6_9BACT|nr:cation diffusion facilitator family transporter [Hymenobacter qilianensis]QNP54482.1 cation transporter [Hymenobacter qilianensis]GGF81142.1 cation efflux system protein [Hymenobacter qilianensis]
MAHLPSSDAAGPKPRGPDHRPGAHPHGLGADTPYLLVWSGCLLLHFSFVLAEAAAGFWGHSAALLADAGRNLGSGLCLGLAWWCGRPARRSGRGRYPYGFHSLPIQISLFTAVGLCVLLGVLLRATMDYLRSPEPVSGLLVGLLAGAGLLLHAGTAGLLLRGQQVRGNGRRGCQYLFTDALVSFGVALGGALLYGTGWPWVDPFLAVVLLGVIAYGCWGLLTPSRLLRTRAEDTDVAAVRAFLRRQPGVREVHQLHIWPLTPTDTALSVHLVRPRQDDTAFIEYLQEALHREFHIRQSTVHLEPETLSSGTPGGG